VRSLTAGAITALSSERPPIILLIEMAFSPPVRVATSAVHIDWNGYTWLGAGPLGSVEPMQDNAGEAQGLKFALSGVPSENIALALGQSARNKACRIYLAILNPDTHAIEDVSALGTFVLDQLTVAGSTIGVSAYALSRVFARPKPLRYTDGDQQLVSAGDRALEYLVSQSTHQDIWPAASWGRK
jgi:predicted ester cyclase